MDINDQLRQKEKDVTYTILKLLKAKTLPDFIMSSLLLSNAYIDFNPIFFAHNVRYGNSVTFKIGVTVESLQYLDNHESQGFDICIECKSTNRPWQLYYH